jgi:secondary thiamine-phosphate synthase enzyme
MPITVSIKTTARIDMVDITHLVRREVEKAGLKEGLCVVYVPHTTSGVTINEGADPAVISDILQKLKQLVPPHDGYRHAEGNSDSHIKASIMGSSVTVLVEGGRPVMGTWQKIFYCEFDGPRSRKFFVKPISC